MLLCLFEKYKSQRDILLRENARALLKKLVDKPPAFLSSTLMSSNSKNYGKLSTPETRLIAFVCSLYLLALRTLTQLKTDILCGLCNDQLLLPKLWQVRNDSEYLNTFTFLQFITSLGPQNGLRAFVDLLADSRSSDGDLLPEFSILALFADAGSTLIAYLDEYEVNWRFESGKQYVFFQVYEEQKPFTLNQLCDMATFGNQFCVRVVWNGVVEIASLNNHALFTSMLHFTHTLYSKDSRRTFTKSDKFWLIKLFILRA